MSKDKADQDLREFIFSINPVEEEIEIPPLELEVNPRPGEPYSAAHARACAEKMRELAAELDAITESSS